MGNLVAENWKREMWLCGIFTVMNFTACHLQLHEGKFQRLIFTLWEVSPQIRLGSTPNDFRQKYDILVQNKIRG